MHNLIQKAQQATRAASASPVLARKLFPRTRAGMQSSREFSLYKERTPLTLLAASSMHSTRNHPHARNHPHSITTSTTRQISTDARCDTGHSPAMAQMTLAKEPSSNANANANDSFLSGTSANYVDYMHELWEKDPSKVHAVRTLVILFCSSIQILGGH